MEKERLQEYAARVTQANRSELVVIIYEATLASIEEGKKYLKQGEIVDIKVENGKVTAVTVDMGEPEQTSELPEKIEVDGTGYEFTGISMGNPHAVLFMDEIDSLELETIGPKFEFHKRFPDRTNTEFVKVIENRQGIKISAIEEIAYKNGWISEEQLLEAAVRYGKSAYGAHLKKVAEHKIIY